MGSRLSSYSTLREARETAALRRETRESIALRRETRESIALRRGSRTIRVQDYSCRRDTEGRRVDTMQGGGHTAGGWTHCRRVDTL